MCVRKLLLFSLVWIPLGQSKTILEYILAFDYKAYLKIENLPGVIYGHHGSSGSSSNDVSILPDFDSESESKDDGGSASSSSDMATLGPDDKRPPDLTDPLPHDFTDVPIGITDPPIEETEPPVKDTEPPVEVEETEPPEDLTDPPVAPPTEAPFLSTEAPTTTSTEIEEITDSPTKAPEEITDPPVADPTDSPTEEPTDVPTPEPTTESPTEAPTEAPTPEATEEPTTAPTPEPTESPTTGVPTKVPTTLGTFTFTGTITFAPTTMSVEATKPVEEELLVPADSGDIFTDISLEVLGNLDIGESQYPTLTDDEKQELAMSITKMIEDEVLATATVTGSALGGQIFEAVVTKLSEYFNSVAEPLDDDATDEEIEAATSSVAQTVLELVRLVLETDVEGPPDLQAYQKAIVSKVTDQMTSYVEENEVALVSIDTERISSIAEQVFSQIEKEAGDEVVNEEYLAANAEKVAQLIATDYFATEITEGGEPMNLSEESLADIASTITEITVSISSEAAGKQ